MTKKDVQKNITEIKNQLVDKYHPEKIILFGSAAWGDFTEDSDLDFLVVKSNVPYYGRDRLKEVYRIVDANLPFDILVYKPEEFDERMRMGDPFVEMIATRGKVLYG